ncbi:MAG TPA: hypothetical protein VKU00_14460 [Chthonomonadaceae bacterium]|nr:hypothetical protein [Chthonomonadaceae bacterium]
MQQRATPPIIAAAVIILIVVVVLLGRMFLSNGPRPPDPKDVKLPSFIDPVTRKPREGSGMKSSSPGAPNQGSPGSPGMGSPPNAGGGAPGGQ